MPIVNESYSSPRYSAYIDRNGTHGTLSVKQEKTITQTGYRSGPLTAAEQAAIENKGIRLGESVSAINYLEGVGYQYMERANRPFIVHDRNATKTHFYGPARIAYQAGFHRGTSVANYDIVGCLAVETLNPTSVMPTPPTNAQLESSAGQLLRDSLPNANSFALARSLGELRDAGLIARGLNLKGLNPALKEKILVQMALANVNVGGTKGLQPADFKTNKRLLKKGAELFLTWVFGIQPTLGDISYVADVIIRHDGHIKRYIEDQERNIRTSRRLGVWQGSGNGSSTSKLASGGSNNLTLTMGPATLKAAYLQVASSGSQISILAPQLEWSWTASQAVRSFANWEFFVPQPTGLPERAASYKEKAERILGEGASAGTVWDLTPYTWLTDWFFDVGGILHYQEQLNNNQVASRSTGWSFYEQLNYQCQFAGHRLDTTGVVNPYDLDYCNSVFATTKAKWTHHVRRGGSPYSVGPTWSLTSQQWSILGALGITKFPL